MGLPVGPRGKEVRPPRVIYIVASPLDGRQDCDYLLSTVKGGLWLGKPVDLVQGTVDLLILKAIGPGPLHGWAIAQRISAG